jgi:hypothetical protein
MRGRRLPLGRLLDGLHLEQGVDARLDVDRDRRLVAHQPAVVVDRADRVDLVPGLDVEQVALQRPGEGRGLRDEQ